LWSFQVRPEENALFLTDDSHMFWARDFRNSLPFWTRVQFSLFWPWPRSLLVLLLYPDSFLDMMCVDYVCFGCSKRLCYVIGYIYFVVKSIYSYTDVRLVDNRKEKNMHHRSLSYSCVSRCEPWKEGKIKMQLCCTALKKLVKRRRLSVQWNKGICWNILQLGLNLQSPNKRHNKQIGHWVPQPLRMPEEHNRAVLGVIDKFLNSY